MVRRKGNGIKLVLLVCITVVIFDFCCIIVLIERQKKNESQKPSVEWQLVAILLFTHQSAALPTNPSMIQIVPRRD